MLKILFTVSFLVSCSICHYTDDYLTPDLELLREICQEIYERIEDIIENVTDEFDIPYEDAMEVWHSMRNENLNFEEYADCGPCLVSCFIFKEKIFHQSFCLILKRVSHKVIETTHLNSKLNMLGK